MKRRQVFRYSLSFFLGLNLVYLKSESVKSENSPDSGDGNNLITSVSGMIPSGLSLKFFQNVLSPNETFNNYYSHFVNEGFKLETDSMNFIDIKNSTKEPFFLSQLSGEKEFESEKTMLVESVNLSSVYTSKGLLTFGASGAILANKFSYDNPLIQALIFYPSSENLFEYEKIERDFLEKESPENIANKIRELKRTSVLNSVSGNSLDQLKKNKRLDLDTSLFVNSFDNFFYLMISIQNNIESSIKAFDHSDKYILEKFNKIIAICINEYKTEIEKFKRLSSITNIASLPEASYGLLDNDPFIVSDIWDDIGDTWDGILDTTTEIIRRTIRGIDTLITIVTELYACYKRIITTIEIIKKEITKKIKIKNTPRTVTSSINNSIGEVTIIDDIDDISDTSTITSVTIIPIQNSNCNCNK
jgi:hypothetical protein